jgi:hypothetical protein
LQVVSQMPVKRRGHCHHSHRWPTLPLLNRWHQSYAVAQ